MKAFVHITLVAACLIACAHALPSVRPSFENDDFDESSNFGFVFPDFSDFLRRSFMNYFWNIPDLTKVKIPEGANTTSTVKIIDGHVVTINETTYSTGDENGGAALRIRIIDVKPENDTLQIGGGSAGPTTVKAEAEESRETVEDINNEIPKNTDVLTA